ncbi:MAG TPA: hypothetical protein VHK06_03665 [Candidatus Limnocylindria bacterium]|nr:hypothetical protein [Candidatus Limnocylindria bacterium]
MTLTPVSRAATAGLRRARVGDRVPPEVLDRTRARRLEATALVVPGAPPLDGYLAALDRSARAFADWDGRVATVAADGADGHRVLVVDRYGQIYDVVDGTEATDLPAPDALEEWFRFLATACPECGVIDDPVLRGPTP